MAKKEESFEVLWEKKYWNSVIDQIIPSKKIFIKKYLNFDEFVIYCNYSAEEDNYDIEITPDISVSNKAMEIMNENVRILEKEGLKTDEVERLKKESELFVQELNETSEFLQDYLSDQNIFYRVLVENDLWPKEWKIEGKDPYEFFKILDKNDNSLLDSEKEDIEYEENKFIKKYLFTKDDWEQVIENLNDPDNENLGMKDEPKLIRDEEDLEKFIDWTRTFWPMEEVEIILDLLEYHPLKKRVWQEPMVEPFIKLQDEFDKIPYDSKNVRRNKFYEGSYCYIFGIIINEVEDLLLEKGFLPHPKNFELDTFDDIGYVYFIRNKDIYKIGITKNLLQRMNQLKPDELLDSVRCSNYKKLEKEIHKQFKEFRIAQTEYFRLDETHISQIHKIFKTRAETE